MDGFESFLDNIIYDNHLCYQERYSDAVIQQKMFEETHETVEFGKLNASRNFRNWKI